MNALLYIIRKSIKNSLLELLKKPGRLIMYLLVIAALAAVIILSLSPKAHMEPPAPLFWLTGILFLFLALFVIQAFVKGLSGGDAIFGMNDVNLLFVSPVASWKILLYGVIRMAKTAFAIGFFILFQANSLANFGIGYDGVMLIFAGFLMSVVLLTIVSLLIYSVTNGREKRKRVVKYLAVLLFLPLVIFTVTRICAAADIFTALETVIQSPFLRFFPVAGWTAGGVAAFLSGDAAAGLLFFGSNLLLGAGMVIYIIRSNPDYYEDALVATETAYEKKRAAAEGNIGAASPGGTSVRMAGVGISGSGAAALFGKHLRESFRQNRFGFLTIPSVLVVIGAILLAMLTRDLLITIQILVWVQILLIGTGRGLKETFSHYIYLIPESSFKKILWSNMEIMVRTLIENVLIFGISGLLLRSHAGYVLSCVAVYTLFSFVLLGVNYLSMRFTGANMSAGLLLMIYYIAVILLLLPGILLAVAVGGAVGGDAGHAAGLLVMSGWELAVGLICFALSKGVLHHCDMGMMKTDK